MSKGSGGRTFTKKGADNYRSNNLWENLKREQNEKEKAKK